MPAKPTPKLNPFDAMLGKIHSFSPALPDDFPGDSPADSPADRLGRDRTVEGEPAEGSLPARYVREELLSAPIRLAAKETVQAIALNKAIAELGMPPNPDTYDYRRAILDARNDASKASAIEVMASKDAHFRRCLALWGSPEPHCDSIRKVGSQYAIFSRKGKLLGKYGTEEEAKKRLRQIEFFKAIAAKNAKARPPSP
jgi:hypothetical protein